MSNEGIFWTQVGTILTLIIGYLFKWWYDARQRRWALEDQQRKADELAKKVEQTHSDVTAKLETNAAKIQENTALTQVAVTEANRAYTSANSYAEKLAKMESRFDGLQRAEEQRRLGQLQRATEHIKETTDESLAILKEKDDEERHGGE